MRVFYFLFLLPVLLSGRALGQSAGAPDTPPVSWMDTVEIQPGRYFDSLIFQTLPGVQYTVETSDDLITWTSFGTPYYGLGQQVVVPMVERLLPTSVPPGVPEDPASTAPVDAFLVMVAGPSGGLTLSFPSADGGTPVQYPFPSLTPCPEWSQVPIYLSEAVSGYTFGIFNSGSSRALPITAPVLGSADQAMIAAFAANFATFNNDVHNSVEHTRSLPPVPAASAGDHLFFRVSANFFLDSDYDGTPDWMEFLAMENPVPGEPPADPFNTDTNGDGIVDGLQRDSDHDGQVDLTDVAPNDSQIGWPRSESMLFASFPLPPTDTPPLQVNNQGIVLYPNSIWKNGKMVDLSESGSTADGEELFDCHAYGMGDNGFIYGEGTIFNGISSTACVVTWPTSGGGPKVLKIDDEYLYPAAGVPFCSPDMIVNTAGNFISSTVTVDDYGYFTLDDIEDRQFDIWTGNPADSTVSGGGAVPSHSSFAINRSSLIAGRTDTGVVTAGSYSFSSMYPRRIVPLPLSGIAACDGVGEPMITDGAGWKSNSTLAGVVDVSSEAKIVICSGWTAWHNGKELGATEVPGTGTSSGTPALPKGDFSHGDVFMPGLQGWSDRSLCSFVDTTPDGWTLAKRDHVPDGSSGTAAPPDSLLALPVFPSTDQEATGLDSVSAVASDDPGFSTDLRAGNKDEFWVMLPANGTMRLKLRTSATQDTPLSLGEASGVVCNPATLTSASTTNVTLTPPPNADGQELPVKMKLGNIISSSTPLKAKIMKARVIKLRVYRVAQAQGSTIVLPPKVDLVNYLNGIYGPQINVSFDVDYVEQIQVCPPNLSDLSPYGNLIVYANNIHGPQLAAFANASGGNISIFVMDGYGAFNFTSASGASLGGITDRFNARCWIDSSYRNAGDASEPENWFNTVAHEIGHVLVGLGHPNITNPAIGPPGPAALPGIGPNNRLMFSYRQVGSPPRTLVKAEWDEAEKWMNSHPVNDN